MSIRGNKKRKSIQKARKSEVSIYNLSIYDGKY